MRMNRQQSKKYEPVIGLEVHVQPATRTKMFCAHPVPEFGAQPNTCVCPVCLGLPGALPVPNKQAIEWTVLIGLALGCKIANFSKFDRKNYFYPDLSKGYQISQYDLPFCQDGRVNLDSGKVVRIRRVHLEEDTGKLIHSYQLSPTNHSFSLIDFNRSGVPLVEIVTEPDISSSSEAKEYVTKLSQIIRYLGVSYADMEKGQMRLEPNVSLRKVTSDKKQVTSLPDYKVEVKNINSFRFVERAINYEIQRQQELLEKGEKIAQETRGFDEKRGITVSQRVKEEAQDYRYFPEPDIPPIRISDSQISDISSQMPELPDAKQSRFMKKYGLTKNQATILTQTKEIAEFFEEAVKDGKKFGQEAKTIANVIINKKIDWQNLLPAQLVQALVQGRREEIEPEVLEKAIDIVITRNKETVESFKKGKTGVLEFLVGQVLKETKSRGNPREIREKLLEKITQKE